MPNDDRRNGEKEKQQEPRLALAQAGETSGDMEGMDERIIRALQCMPDAEFEALAEMLADMRQRGQGPSVH